MIAEIVITPGQDMNRSEYLHRLPDSVELLGVASWRSVPLLEKLLDEGDPELRDYACLALGGIFYWADQCLMTVVEHAHDDIQARARELIQRNAKFREADEKELSIAPAIFFSRLAPGGSHHARFVLERLLKRPDPTIRAKASDLLKEMTAAGY